MNRSLVLALCLLAPVSSARAACPESCIRVPGIGTTCSSDPARVVTATAEQTGQLCTSTFEAKYDLPRGTLSLHSGSPFGGCDAEVAVADEFVVQGVPAGTPVTFFAMLYTRPEIYCALGRGTASASLEAPGDDPLALSWSYGPETCSPSQPNHWVTTLIVHVVGTAGAPLPIRFTVGGTMGELFTETVEGELHFDGLPHGATIVSCNGFVGQNPVATRATSWGQLKAGYR